MRAAIVLALGLAACSPDILSGSYLCGPDQSCPTDQACNGSDNTCVIASTASPFACTTKEEHEPDNTPAQGLAVGALDCVSTTFSQHGCLAAGDTADWFTLTAPTGCTALAINIRVTYPIAFETVGVNLTDPTGTLIASDAPCKVAGTAGDDDRCLVQTITPGSSYAIQVKPAGGGDCDGKCNFNRYTLAIQLQTP
jgi:hypothetical protein